MLTLTKTLSDDASFDRRIAWAREPNGVVPRSAGSRSPEQRQIHGAAFCLSVNLIKRAASHGCQVPSYSLGLEKHARPMANTSGIVRDAGLSDSGLPLPANG